MLLHVNLSYEMILTKSQLFMIFSISFGVQEVYLEEKVRKGVYAHFENKWGSLKSII